MKDFYAYIPMDRRLALARGETLPDRTEGAALFADISGFTPLTAALLKELGLKRGSEELPRQLNLVYDALITEIHRFGASVLSFSGDAVTCWLDGDDGTHATACALALQETMRQFESMVTPAGTTVSLGLKVAVAIGPVRRFSVGDPTLQLIDTLAGATLERVADAEHQAERGDVIVAPEVVAKIGDKLQIAEFRPDPDTGVEFARVTGLTETVLPPPMADLPGELSDDQVRPWLLPPVYDRLQREIGDFLAEIRPSVALFVRFGGIDYDSDAQAGDKLDAYIRWVQGILAKYGSYILQLTIGDKGCYLYSSFGSPESHDDDPARAVAAALEIQSPPEDLNYIGVVQAGISQGRMRCGAYGGQTRRTYGVLGDEVNMAARLMGHAAPGQVLVSQRVADAVADLYNLQSLGRIKVKGKDEPIPAALALGRRQTALLKPVNLFPTPLVGREAELARVEQILATAEAGQSGQIFRVEGVAGIGKSHLIAVVADQAIQVGWRVVLGACQSINQSIAYHPWQQIFKALFLLLDDDTTRQVEQVQHSVEALNPDWLVRLPLLGELLDLPIPDNATTAAFEPQLRQEALFTFALDLIRSWAQAQPLLLLIEDVHWLDEASRGLLMALARVVAEIPLVLAVVQRPPLDDAHPILPELDRLPNDHFIDLGELSPEGVAAVIANRLKGQPSPLLTDLIVVQANGNPFFVEEMTDTLREADHLVQQEDGDWTLSDTLVDLLQQANCLMRNQAGQLALNPAVPLSAADLGLPDSIQQVVLSRLDRLLEEQRLTLKVASVIGRVFEFDLLAKAHPVEGDQERLMKQVEIIERREFSRLEIPLPNLTHLFKHNITRDVAYETLLESQQRELHRVVGQAMEDIVPEAVEQLAYHYSRAKVADKAAHYLGLAAQKAQREYANETALAFYEQALTLENRWTWRKGQIEVLHLLGRREAEQAALEQLEATPDAPPFEVAYLWGQYYEAIADYPQAQAAVERALAAARTNGERLAEIRCLGQLGLIARRQGDYAVAKGWYEQALVDFDEQQESTTEKAHAFAQVLNGLGIVHRQQGEFEETRARHEQALKLCSNTKNQYLLAETTNFLGVSASYQRHFEEAQVYHQAALEIRRTIGNRAGEGISLFNLSLAAYDTGNYRVAEQYLQESLSIQQASANHWEEVNVWNGLGTLYQELGQLKQAQECLENAMEISIEIGDEIGQAYVAANLGLIATDEQDLDRAVEVLNDGINIAQKHDDKHILAYLIGYLSVVNLRAGRFQEATEQANTSLNLHRESKAFLLTADDLATLASIHLAGGHLTQALTYGQEAMQILTGCNGEGPEFPQRDYFICYQVFSASNQAGRAQQALQSAYNLVMARADNITDPALRQSFLGNVAINREIVVAYEQAQK